MNTVLAAAERKAREALAENEGWLGELGLWLQAGRARAAVVRPDRTVLCAGRNLAEVCDAVPVFAPPADTGADG